MKHCKSIKNLKKRQITTNQYQFGMKKSIVSLLILFAILSCKKKDTATDITYYISVKPISYAIIVNGTQQLVATISPGNAPNKTVIWSSSDGSVATVDPNGLVTGKSVGSATITAMSQASDKIATCNITVKGSTTAVNAIDLLSSIGVCTHIGQGIDNAAKSATALAFAGIRNIRDDGSASHVQDWILVHNTAGTKTVLVASGPNDAKLTNLISWSRQLADAGALLALEGPNEPNNWKVTYQGQTSGSTTSLPIANWLKDYYSQAKSDPVLQNYPVFHSSEAGGSEPDNVGLQFLAIPSGTNCLMPDGTKYADYANVHNYICRQDFIIDNMAWLNASPDNVNWVDGIYQEYGSTWAGHFAGYSAAERATLPKVTTETGWVTGTAPKQISEEQQGRLFLNLYLSQFKRGFKYTFIYMLRDGSGSDTGYGIFKTDYTAKISGTYLHNFTTILSDNNSIPTLGQLNYVIPNQPETTHDLLLQKSNGKFELVVWSERASGSDNITVNFGGTLSTVKVYDPTTGILASQTLNNVNSVTLTVSDHPVIIEIDK